jgi:hypothetical protein
MHRLKSNSKGQIWLAHLRPPATIILLLLSMQQHLKSFARQQIIGVPSLVIKWLANGTLLNIQVDRELLFAKVLMNDGIELKLKRLSEKPKITNM